MNGLTKYVACARIAMTEAARDRAELGGRAVFVVIILGVFSSLWRTVSSAGAAADVDRRALVWYIAVTEWIVLSVPAIHTDIEIDVRRGDVACHLARPVSYLGALAGRGLGLLAVRAPVVGAAAFASAWVFTRWIPPPSSFAVAVPLALASMVVVLGLWTTIGLAAFWVGDVLPIFWVSQKLLFILGGMMLPLSFYPGWVQHIARATPFPAMLAGPAGFMLTADPKTLWHAVLDLACWGAAITAAAQLLFTRALRQLQINGG